MDDIVCTTVSLENQKVSVRLDTSTAILAAGILEKLEEIRCNQIDIEDELTQIKKILQSD